MRMKKRHYLITVIAIVIGVAINGCGREKTPEEIRAEVEKSIVLISSNGEREKIEHGTGFFVKGEAGRCTVITTAHVVKGKNKLQLKKYNNQLIEEAKSAKVKYLPGDYDLALVTFPANGENCQYETLKLGDSEKIKLGERVRVFGYPQRLGEERLILQFSSGEITNIQKPPLPQGYAISYNASTFSGMSGSPIINKAGEVIAIHGKADLAKLSQEQKSEIESQLQARIETFSWGIPIKTYIENAHFAQATPPPLKTFSFETITINEKGEKIKTEKHEAQYFSEDLGNNVTMDMVLIPAGKFLMGSPETEKGRSNSESPQRQVTVASFFMGKYTVTQAQWKAVAALPQVKIPLKPEPSYFKGDNLPVDSISWEEAIEFCARLTRKTGREYRLPSEAEWEYAARAGTTTPFYFGETITSDLANYNAIDTYALEPKGIFRGKTTPVGSFPPNAFGLYDMHGNVWEWVADSWHDNYEGAPSDGSVWETEGKNDARLLRGCSWDIYPQFCRVAYRNRIGFAIGGENIGFRVATSFVKIPSF